MRTELETATGRELGLAQVLPTGGRAQVSAMLELSDFHSRLTRSCTALPTVPTLRFSVEGKYKILQVADLHFSVGPGECRDMDPQHEQECKDIGADVYSLKWLETALDETEPDLVVFSGDQLNGQKTSWDAQSVIMKFAPLVYQRNIPWTIIFGNHDEEDTDLDHEKQMSAPPGILHPEAENARKLISHRLRRLDAPLAPLYRRIRSDRRLWSRQLCPLDPLARRKSGRPPPVHHVLPRLARDGQEGQSLGKVGVRLHQGRPVSRADLSRWSWRDFLTWPFPSRRINWFRGRSAQIHSYTRPYNVDAQISASNSLRIRRRSRPARSAKRQADGDDAKWTEAAVDELKSLEKEFGLDGALNPAVEPDDGSSVVNDPEAAGEKGATFDEEATATDGAQSEDATTAEVSSAKYLEEEDELLEGAADMEPTVLPAGPTRANPMQAKPNAM